MKAMTASDRLLAKSAPADIAQVTLLIDESASMDHLGPYVRDSIETVLGEFEGKEGAVIAIRSFAYNLKTISEFGEPVPNAVAYRPRGETALYASVAEAIQKSQDDAALTPEIKTHHVICVITDGYDTCGTDEHLRAAQRKIDEIDVDATFLLLDFSFGGNSGARLGLTGIHIKDNTPAAFKDAMAKLRQALGQIRENVIRQLPPATGLCLPPAR